MPQCGTIQDGWKRGHLLPGRGEEEDEHWWQRCLHQEGLHGGLMEEVGPPLG